MKEISWIMSWSLVVASRTLSQVTAIVLSVAVADDASTSYVVSCCGGGALRRIPARVERLRWCSGNVV